MTTLDYITPKDVAEFFHIPVSTQRVWKSTNRYGWRNLTIKRGACVIYKKSDIEAWIESRKGLDSATPQTSRSGG